MALTTTLFDMDGLLLDSEILWHQAELEILGNLGVPIDAHGTRATKGMFVDEVVAHWHRVAPWPSPDQATVVAMVLDRVGELVETVGRLLPGAERAIDLSTQLGAVGLASSTPTALIRRCLDHFQLTDRFEVIASAADEPYGKPHPGVFLTAAARLGASPSSCLVYEDSAAGVLAAKAGRMQCVAVPTADERSQPAFQLADLVLNSLDELDASWLAARFAR